ncbi:hypothetical protein FALCPG4_19048 [Fusarium falciforme]
MSVDSAITSLKSPHSSLPRIQDWSPSDLLQGSSPPRQGCQSSNCEGAMSYEVGRRSPIERGGQEAGKTRRTTDAMLALPGTISNVSMGLATNFEEKFCFHELARGSVEKNMFNVYYPAAKRSRYPMEA